MANYEIDVKFPETTSALMDITLSKTKMVGFETDGNLRLSYQHDGEGHLIYWTPDGYPQTTGSLVIGTGEAGVDYTITFDGENYDGVITWKQDQDYFIFSDDIVIPFTENIYFGGTQNYINGGSSDDLYIVSGNTHFYDPISEGGIITIGDILITGTSSGYDLAISAYDYTFGDGTELNKDIIFTFYGNPNTGVITWIPEEDYFIFSDDILIPQYENIYFGSTRNYINGDSSDDLYIVSGTTHFSEPDSGAGTITVGGTVITGTSSGYDLAISAYDYTFGDGTELNKDIIFTFYGNPNTGVITWIPEEDYFQFSKSVRLGYIPSSTNAANTVLVSDDGVISYRTLLEIAGSLDHGSIAGLTDDDHVGYARLAGRSGGQTMYGGTGSSDYLTLHSTSNATKGRIVLQDEVALNTVSNAVGDFMTISSGGGAITSRTTEETASDIQGSIDHGSVAGLTDDDHVGYARLAGRSGGQTMYGGTAASNGLVLSSTSHATKGETEIIGTPIRLDLGTGYTMYIESTGIGDVVNISFDAASDSGVLSYSGTSDFFTFTSPLYLTENITQTSGNDIYTGSAYGQYSGSWSGFSASGTQSIKYKCIGKRVFLDIEVNQATTNGSDLKLSIPSALTISGSNSPRIYQTTCVNKNGTDFIGAVVSDSSTSLQFYPEFLNLGTTWTNTEKADIFVRLSWEIA
jgi:hypothetical protein